MLDKGWGKMEILETMKTTADSQRLCYLQITAGKRIAEARLTSSNQGSIYFSFPPDPWSPMARRLCYLLLVSFALWLSPLAQAGDSKTASANPALAAADQLYR